MAQITFYELSAYNSGLLLDFTVDLDNCTDHSDYRQAIKEQLDELKETYGEEYPDFTFEEWIVAEVDEVPEKYICTFDLDPEYWDYIEAVNEHGEDVVEAALECGVPLDSIEDAYCGYYDGDGTSDDRALGNYAYELAKDTGELNENSWLSNFIDWDAAGRALSYDGYCQYNGHVFHSV